MTNTNANTNYSSNDNKRKSDNTYNSIESNARNIGNSVDYNGNTYKSSQQEKIVNNTSENNREQSSTVKQLSTQQKQQQQHSDSISAFAQKTDDHFIKCIFLCKFHAVAGPQIAAQVPKNYIPKDVFDTISQYVIPKSQLQRCFVSA